jgi:tRNA threonylcarbamoyladenosine biosynthesis protein TsaB
MRVLGLETSSERGSVALIDGGVVVAQAHHVESNRHAELMLSLVTRALSDADWDKQSLERIAVGVGPGAFTGIRIGIALAHGLGLGLGIPTVGVGSLRAIALAHPKEDTRLRLVVRDARRDEVFVAAYDALGAELSAPAPWPRSGLRERLESWAAGREIVVLGEVVPGLDCVLDGSGGAPDAAQVALWASRLDPAEHPPFPMYARGPGADPQHLTPSPLLLPRS